MIAVTMSLAGTATAEIRYTQNGTHQTTRLGGLSDDPSCTMINIGGKVVQRNFAKDGVTMSGFAVEMPDGTRQHVNVWISDDLNMAEKSIVYDGLQRLLREGREMKGQATACGAAGRILMLDSVR